MADTSLYRTKCRGPDWICITRNTLRLSEMRTPRYSVKRTDFAVPLIPGLYKIHSIMQTLAGLLHKIVQHCWFIHQLDTVLTLVRIVLASGYPFLLSYSKGEPPSLHSTAQVRIVMPTGNTPEPPLLCVQWLNVKSVLKLNSSKILGFYVDLLSLSYKSH